MGTSDSQQTLRSLPVFGVDPGYVGMVLGCTAAATLANRAEWLHSGAIAISWLRILLAAIGVAAALAGVVLWVGAVVVASVDRRIQEGKLVTSGVYAWVRHPIYSAFWLVGSGILIAQGNLWLLILPVGFWALLTVMVASTEEKWLQIAFGDEYLAYARRVNRCIPWPPRRTPAKHPTGT